MARQIWAALAALAKGTLSRQALFWRFLRALLGAFSVQAVAALIGGALTGGIVKSPDKEKGGSGAGPSQNSLLGAAYASREPANLKTAKTCFKRGSNPRPISWLMKHFADQEQWSETFRLA